MKYFCLKYDMKNFCLKYDMKNVFMKYDMKYFCHKWWTYFVSVVAVVEVVAVTDLDCQFR